MAKRIRQIDSDLRAYLECVGDEFVLDDIANIYAEVSGCNEEEHWFWILKLNDGRFTLTEASCDYTGWGCQADGSSKFTRTALAAAKLAPEKDSFGRNIRATLIAQLRGTQPFGTTSMTAAELRGE